MDAAILLHLIRPNPIRSGLIQRAIQAMVNVILVPPCIES